MTPDERNAMRAYLQRAEVRLSTLHRIATAFIGGSGLLLLFPAFFKDVIITILDIWLNHWGNEFEWAGTSLGWILTALLFVSIGIPFIMSLSFPVYGVYLMLKDTVHFYYTLYAPGFSEQALTPSFALTGILFSPDESPTAKREIYRYEYDEEHIDYMLPFSEGKRHIYFDTIADHTANEILTPTRPANLREEIAPQLKPETYRYFNAALGITRSRERDLVQEVATMEMSLTRHIMYLRRLVLRYMKTLLMFLWTTIISFLMLPFLRHGDEYFFVFLAIGYGLWAVWVMHIMRMPLGWIYRHREHHIEWDHVDPQLTLMEDDLSDKVLYAQISALIGLILAILTLF